MEISITKFSHAYLFDSILVSKRKYSLFEWDMLFFAGEDSFTYTRTSIYEKLMSSVIFSIS